MTNSLKVLTLNSWALPFPVICKNRLVRIQAIGEYLSQSDYDFVILQEIWVKSDFQYLKEKLQETMPHCHYFYSGAIGSGVCIFSKHPIIETNFHRFQLNGHAHKIYHGDWFGGKGVGLAKIQAGDLDVYLYCTHFHAEYNPGNDEYHAHRICQSFELGQFIKATMEGSDLVMVAGDLNTPPGCLGYRVITLNPELTDCWKVKTNEVEIDSEFGGTCALPGNSYTPAASAKKMPEGERIDYIMYRTRKGLKAEVTCKVGLGIIPGTRFSYSDHEAVMVTVCLTNTEEESETPEEETTEKRRGLSKDLKDALQESVLILDKGISQCLGEEKFFKVMLFLMACGLYLMGYMDNLDMTGGAMVTAVVALGKLCVAIGIGFCIWTALIVKRSEFYTLVGAKEDVSRLLHYGGSKSQRF